MAGLCAVDICLEIAQCTHAQVLQHLNLLYLRLRSLLMVQFILALVRLPLLGAGCINRVNGVDWFGTQVQHSLSQACTAWAAAQGCTLALDHPHEDTTTGCSPGSPLIHLFCFL